MRWWCIQASAMDQLIILGTCLCTLVLGHAALASPAEEHVPLHRWYSASRGDNFTTADPAWAGAPGLRRSPDYGYSRLTGYILSPDTPLREGLVPLHSWWSSSRGDNFITSHPDWHGSPGETRSPDYEYVRLEGFAFAEPVAGTVPLHSWYSPSRGDNSALTHWSWWSYGLRSIRDTRSPDYEHVRVEGWILPPSEYGELALGPTFGFERRPVRRRLNTLLILEAFSDTPFSTPTSSIRQRFFGPGRISVDRILRTVSGGRVSLSQSGVVRVTQPYPLADVLEGGEFTETADENAVRRADPLFDFRQLDKNGDGRLTKDEALIIKLLANNCACGQQRGTPNLRLDGVNIAGSAFAAICQNAHWHVLAEEIGHSFGFVDLYGFNASLNGRATFMADNCGINITSPVGPFLLDPWHRMTAGWMQPRPLPISAASGSAVINATDRVGPRSPLTRRPVLLYDPRRSLDEYFILQHRSPLSPSGLDAGVVGEGLAVWYTNVHKRNPLRLETFDWPPPFTENNSDTGDSNAHYYLTADGSAASGGFLSAGEQLNLRWGNGANTGLTVHVQRTSAAESEVMWTYDRSAFKPRIDRAIARQGRIHLEGVFPSASGPSMTLELRTASGMESVVLGRRGRGGERSFSFGIPVNTQNRMESDAIDVRASITGDPRTRGNWLRVRSE